MNLPNANPFGRNYQMDKVMLNNPSAGPLVNGQNLSASEKNDLEDFKISAKKKFGSKTYANLSYKKSFSLTNPDQLQIGVEYKLNRNLSLVGNMDDKGNLHLKYRYRYAY